MGFGFYGSYDKIDPHKRIAYTTGDGRKTEIAFLAVGGSTRLIETFDAENANPVDMQKAGWQALLENFRQYVEGSLAKQDPVE